MRLGHIIADICPQRENPSATAFVFYVDRWLQTDLDRIMNGDAADHRALQDRLAGLGVSEAEYRQQIFKEYLAMGGDCNTQAEKGCATA